MLARLKDDGFVLVNGFLSEEEAISISRQVEPLLKGCSAPGIRRLTEKVPAIAVLAASAKVRSLVEQGLGKQAKLVRSILFNKDKLTNWHVSWHQDLSIAVRQRADIPGFHSWSIKDGVQHVQPPIAILERMLTIRIHLDPADEANGALWVSPGSHLIGRIQANEANSTAETGGKMLCGARRGDALVMKPLLLHASSKARNASSRRVIHLEFAAIELPAPLEWAEAVAA